MKNENDLLNDITHIRSMMERSTKFLSLTGLSGVLAGLYALAGAFLAYTVFDFNPDSIYWKYNSPETSPVTLYSVIAVAGVILVLALVTAATLSARKASLAGEKIWNTTTRRLLANFAVPLVTGGVVVIIMVIEGMTGLAAPLTLIFYGLALHNAGNFTYKEVKYLGITQIILGLAATIFIGWGLVIWAAGFGVANIVYGVLMHYKYEK